jgi:lysophospholipid acyltransferase 1/2
VSLLLGFPFRTFLSPDKTSTYVRHVVQIAIGVPMCYFCFGSQMLHYLISSLACYALMVFLKPGIMEKAVFVVSMGYLAVMHIYRQVYDYGGYTLDITGFFSNF